MRATGEVFRPLSGAINVLLGAGGKRVRPALALLASKLYPNAERDKVVSLAAAIEMLHSATLVHDDVIDGSLLRRGNPTLNASWSQGATILAGDFIFARAAVFASETDNVRVMRVFSQTLMTICEGELRQLFDLRNWQQPKDAYYERIYGKTAALFATATEAAAVLGSAPEAEITALHDYGYNVGMAFQIMDDVLDFVGSCPDGGQASGQRPAPRHSHAAGLPLPAVSPGGCEGAAGHRQWPRLDRRADPTDCRHRPLAGHRSHTAGG